MDNEKLLICVILGVLLTVVFLCSRASSPKRKLKRKNKKIKKSIMSQKFIYYRDFENNWICSKSNRGKGVGYKYNDRPGCYVITIYDDWVRNNNFMKYENIYVGQSINVCQRVHNHFNGKGNGDIYADIKYGKKVYVRIVPCDKKKMNTLEKDLIGAFNATNSYNHTKGGGLRR